LKSFKEIMTEPKYVDSLGFRVYSDELDFISINNVPARLISTISPNSYGICTYDKDFRDSLKKSDYLVLDGVYFALASILLKGKNIRRNQGPDVFYHFMNRLAMKKSRVFFMGSNNETLAKIKNKVHRIYPNIEVGYYSPPFKNHFSEEENAAMVEAVNAFKPDIVFVGMTCPKQEKWSALNKDVLNAGLIICIGNVFDWFAGTQKIIKPIWYSLRVGWLVRIFLRPEILKRNIGNQLKFFSDVFLLFFRIKKRNTFE
jgi:N-acetylglucosaminyldiphosphoundecaprenol N-acetyl-beta-D-mannosaminyltransferase